MEPDTAAVPVTTADASAALIERLSPATALDQVAALRDQFARLLVTPERDQAWREALAESTARLRALTTSNADETLYFLLHACTQDTAQYSATHAMACAAIGGLVAGWFNWPDAEVGALWLASITMNISMTELQDRLASQEAAPSSADQEVIGGHAEASADLLRSAGLDDPLMLRIVAGHHTRSDAENLDTLEPALKLREVLRRIDIYTAKLSRRRQRHASTPALAARDALLSADGTPDALGAALLRVLGLYPPGSWVALANGDTGLVIRRGDRAHTPTVAAVQREDGGIYFNPVRRQTARASFAVVKGLRHADVRITLNHGKVVSCAE